MRLRDRFQGETVQREQGTALAMLADSDVAAILGFRCIAGAQFCATSVMDASPAAVAAAIHVP